jgi:DNA-binding CsgD family transcriptional regulator
LGVFPATKTIFGRGARSQIIVSAEVEERRNTDSLQSERIGRLSRRAPATLVLLDAQCNVLCVTRQTGNDPDDYASLIGAHGGLRPELEPFAQALIAKCERTSERHAIAFIDDDRFARVTVLDGNAGRIYALTLEHDRKRDNLGRAARRYALTKRELQVLAFILEGASAHEVAAAMHIAETTVQGYYKRLLSKTQSRNRPAMVASVCEWEGAR